jgi:hypothetical protein
MNAGRIPWRNRRFGATALLVAAACGALVTYAFMGGFDRSSSCCAPAANAARGVINGLRAGDPVACDAMTSAGQEQAATLLGASRSEVTSMIAKGLDPCGTTLLNLTSRERERALTSFYTDQYTKSGGSGSSRTSYYEWRKLTDGTYAVITLTNDKARGWLVDSLEHGRNCSVCPDA